MKDKTIEYAPFERIVEANPEPEVGDFGIVAMRVFLSPKAIETIAKAAEWIAKNGKDGDRISMRLQGISDCEPLGENANGELEPYNKAESYDYHFDIYSRFVVPLLPMGDYFIGGGLIPIADILNKEAVNG